LDWSVNGVRDTSLGRTIHLVRGWPRALEEEFADTQVTLPRGETVSMKLAERGSWVGDKKDGLWVREVRKLNSSGH